MTHSASCSERSASSSTILLLPRRSTVAVRPLFWMPVKRTMRPLPTCRYAGQKDSGFQGLGVQGCRLVGRGGLGFQGLGVQGCRV